MRVGRPSDTVISIVTAAPGLAASNLRARVSARALLQFGAHQTISFVVLPAWPPHPAISIMPASATVGGHSRLGPIVFGLIIDKVEGRARIASPAERYRRRPAARRSAMSNAACIAPVVAAP